LSLLKNFAAAKHDAQWDTNSGRKKLVYLSWRTSQLQRMIAKPGKKSLIQKFVQWLWRTKWLKWMIAQLDTKLFKQKVSMSLWRTYISCKGCRQVLTVGVFYFRSAIS
jgi:hypothetical protein